MSVPGGFSARALSQAWLFIAGQVTKGLATNVTAQHNAEWGAAIASDLADALLDEYVKRDRYFHEQARKHKKSNDADSDDNVIDAEHEVITSGPMKGGPY